VYVYVNVHENVYVDPRRGTTYRRKQPTS
jgi:hypothetical protein